MVGGCGQYHYRNEDVTESLYPVPSWYRSETVRHEYESKVNTVCDTVISALSTRGKRRYKRLSLTSPTLCVGEVTVECVCVCLSVKTL